MSLGDWIGTHKLAAGGIAAGAGFLYLSHRGGGGLTGNATTDPQGQLVPVAAAYDTSTDTAPSEQAQAAADSAATAAQAAQDAADAANSNNGMSMGDFIDTVQQGQVAGILPPFAATPAPSSVPATQAAPGPTPTSTPSPVVPAPTPAPAPSDPYAPGVNGWEAPNSQILAKFPSAISFKIAGNGSNSNGSYWVVVVNTKTAKNQNFHYYLSGAKKGDWVAIN